MNNDLPIKDKMAVVFHGIVGGMSDRNGDGDPTNIADCAKTIHYNVLSQYDCDIFGHSWSIDQEEQIKKSYNFTNSLFQPQEYFGFTGKQVSSLPIIGQSFRSTSRYTSLERAMRLKQQHEIKNEFRYKWVLVLRYDLVIFTKLDLSTFDPRYIYICQEPHWINNTTLFDDRLFLSNSTIMNQYATFGDELRRGIYVGKDIHADTRNKLISIVKDLNLIKFGFKRYEDVEIYRLLMLPETNPVGHAYGALECKPRLIELIKKINNE